MPTDGSRIARYNRIESVGPFYRGSWYSVVDGGLWWWDFQFREGASATFAVEIDRALQATSRSDLNASLAETFIDEPL